MASIRTEIILSLANRAIPPAATYLSLIAFGRILTSTEFNNYLISMTVAMWAVATAFQWQKNAAIRFLSKEEKDISKYITIAAISSAIATAAILIHSIFDERVSKTIVFFVVSTGLTYLLGGILRSIGETKKFLISDTGLNIAKWSLGVSSALIIPSSNFVFIALSIGASSLSIALYILIKKSGYRSQLPDKQALLNTRPIFRFGACLIIIDFFGSGLMYIDRFWITDQSISEQYIIASNIGCQIASIAMGAFLMIAYPRISQSYKSSLNWEAQFKKYLMYFPLFAVACCSVSLTASPALTSLIKPSLTQTPYLALTFTISQCSYYLLALTSIPYLLILKPKYPAIINGIAFVVFFFTGAYLSQHTENLIHITTAKTAILVAASLASSLIFKKIQRDHQEKCQG